MHFTERTHRPLHRGFLPRSPVRNPTIRRASFGRLNGHATRANIIPPFEDRADLQRFANSHLITLATFDPPSIVLAIDFHRASSPSRYRFILPPFPNANASRLIFYNFIEPTGRMVDVVEFFLCLESNENWFVLWNYRIPSTQEGYDDWSSSFSYRNIFQEILRDRGMELLQGRRRGETHRGGNDGVSVWDGLGNSALKTWRCLTPRLSETCWRGLYSQAELAGKPWFIRGLRCSLCRSFDPLSCQDGSDLLGEF